ncbi:MAG: 3'-5' exonuclease [Cellulosilyticaceae bacterium]
MFKQDWKDLNQQQQQAVTCIDPNCLVLAPAGTGKTKVIAMRTAHLLQHEIDPYHILCLTFTNKAAKEMEERIAFYDQANVRQLTIKTFHSFCYYLINHEKDASHFTFPCSILDEADSLEIIQKITDTIDPTYDFDYKLIANFIEHVKRYSLTFPVAERYAYKEIVPSYLKEYTIKDTSLTHYGLKILSMYQKYLRKNNCVDFMDLIVEAKYLLEDPDVAKKWQYRYRYIQVDEMQDTSCREFEIIKILAQGNNLAMFGDFNQTIYEWRGSAPTSMVDEFKTHFQPIQIDLSTNYRSTQALLKAANNYIRNSQLYPLECQCQSSEVGEPIQVLRAANKHKEFVAIAESISQKKEAGAESLAVLTRTNGYAAEIHKVLTQYGVPCIKVDDIRLFRRKEVKEVLALFEYAINERNSYALHKCLTHPAIHMEDWLLQRLKPAVKAHMQLHDWFNSESNDPYAQLFTSFKKHQLVVLDVESTGLDTTLDDIIQIAAIRYGEEGVREELDVLLKPTKPVGDSYFVHGFSDETLEMRGIEPKLALQQMLDFIEGKVLIGHNIKYDLQIINSMLYRYDMPQIIGPVVYDTLDLACKIYPNLSNHKLETLSKLIETQAKPNHNALQDILATGEVLSHFIAQLKQTQSERLTYLEDIYPYLCEYKAKVSSMRDTLLSQPTYESIGYIMNECGFKPYYSKEQIEGIRELYQIAKELYDEGLSLEDNIIKLLATASLHYSQLEQTDLFKGKVPIMTVHQSKGLEFDTVYIAGCNEGLFPLTKSVNEGYLGEEKRLFYVAMTRAKKYLYLTYNTTRKMSFLVEEIGEDFKNYVQT